MPENPTTSSEDTRQRLIGAALKLFGQVGYTRASTRLIAETAGVNEVTLFRHFGSKKNLLMACMETFNAGGFAATFEAELSGDYPGDIACMARLQLKNTAENLDVLHLLLSDPRNVPELQEAMRTGGGGNMACWQPTSSARSKPAWCARICPPKRWRGRLTACFPPSVIIASLFRENNAPLLPEAETFNALVDLFVSGTQAA